MTKLVAPNSSEPATILIVEDERAVARDLQDCLEGLGYRVVAIAGSSTDALDYMASLQPNLVLMDIVLEDSDQDGIETARQIRDRFAVPVVFLTAHATPSVVAQVQATEPFGYILKPFREKDLWVAIETALQRSTTEHDLVEREAWLTQALIHIGAGIVVFDAQSQVQFLNTTAANLIGWEQVHALHAPLQQVLPLVKLDTQKPLWANLLPPFPPDSQQLALDGLLLRSGEVLPVLYCVTSLSKAANQGRGGVIIFWDLQSLQATIADQSDIVRSPQMQVNSLSNTTLGQLQNEFFAHLSAELRHPLTTIKMAAKTLSLNLEQLNLGDVIPRDRLSVMAQGINLLNEQTDYEIQLINNLLDILNLQAKTYPLELTTIELETWLPKMMEPFYLRANQNAQVLRLVMPAELPPYRTDPHYLSQILTELLNNACRHTPPGEQIIVTVQYQSFATSTERKLLLEVCSFGLCLSTTEQERVFDEFYHISRKAHFTNSDRQQQRETGLELPLVKRFVQLLGGQVQVFSQPKPAQTCFQMQFPLN